jgi:curli biogenesis system outer membrane secretion channel CsgG
VQISTRLVSPDTGEVLAVSQGTGKVNRKGVKVDIRDSSQVSIMGGNANNPLMNECMDNAIAQLAAQFRRLGLDLKRILAFDVREDAGFVGLRWFP